MFALLLRDSVYSRITSVLVKYDKHYSKFEAKDEIVQEEVDSGVIFEFSFVIYSYNITEIVHFFNKYFYAVSKSQSIETRASTDGKSVFLNVRVKIERDMIDSML